MERPTLAHLGRFLGAEARDLKVTRLPYQGQWVIGIAAVSCVLTTSKVAQKEARDASKFAVILPWAMGASISGVITSAIVAAIYVTLLR